MTKAKSKFKKRNPVVVFFWCVGIMILIQIIFAIGLIIPIMLKGSMTSNILNEAFHSTGSSIFIGLYSLLIGVPAMMLITKYLWRRDRKWMALSFNGKMLLAGFLFGICLPVIILLILAVPCSLEIQLYPDHFSFYEILAAIFGFLGLMVFVGYEEEVVFRGMLTREWASRVGWVISTILAGTIFGFIHVFNLDSATIDTAIYITLSGLSVSIMLVTMYVRFYSLWPAIGFHAGWNFMIIAILGTPISGLSSEKSLFVINIDGPIWLTGGQFGIETSFVTFIMEILAIIIIIKYPFQKEVLLMPAMIKEAVNKAEETEKDLGYR